MIKKVHLGLLAIILLNLLLYSVFDLGINNAIMFLVRVLMYASGVLLFFITIKNRSAITFYSSLYILSPLVVFFSWLADGILGALVGSMFFAFLAPPNNVVQNDKYQLRSQFTGFLGGCCSYSLYETKLSLFEKKIGEFRAERTSNEIADLEIYGGRAVVYYKEEPTDSTLIQIK
ncbi:hypothetical protein [Pontibacter flavimaris]|uniref:Uncharacterized protein n=1 Tax=Pontibacter flavimaris TaxID=1797110 RepID=A0A1Q5PGL2_9BACT|nr:hypothetical protein [Pontibacter flavimaris]OKL41355.1 hypothetical protein A3841_09830 [Pontibacter flavimaris]